MIWRAGVDDWRDLSGELACAPFTAVSRSGTARLIDRRWGSMRVNAHLRLPLEGGHSMLEDGTRDLHGQLMGWGRLEEFRVTPCGITIVEPGSWIDAAGDVRGFGYWAKGTPLRVVLAGLVPQWHRTATGRAVIDEIVTGAPAGSVAGHPDRWCGALYCPYVLATE